MPWRALVFGMIFVWISSCGDATSLTGQYFIVKMQGTYSKAASSQGNDEPISQTYTLASVQLFDENNNATELLEAKDRTPIRVNNQLQKILMTPIQTQWEEKTFKRLEITFDSEVKGVSRDKSDHMLTLTEPTVSYTDSMTLPKGKDFSVLLKVLWKDTVLRQSGDSADTMSLPDFAIKKLD